MFSKAEAWIDILWNVQWKEEPQDVVLGMTVLKQHYGECLKSARTWAYRWNWSPSKVRRFLAFLEKKLGQIRIKNEGVTTRIFVINFEQYDPRRNTNGASVERERPTSDPQVVTNNKDKKVNKERIPFVEIVNYLNAKSGKNFKNNTKETRRAIRARWNEGFRLPDFKRVIVTKCAKWKSDEKMVDYLRPQTLFGTKFEGYLNESPPIQQKSVKTSEQEDLERWQRIVQQRKSNTTSMKT